MSNKPNMYDYLIVGAGISGLYTAYKINTYYPNKKICIIEATNYIGGRLHSIKYDGIIVDGGGARFNTKQHRVVSLVKELQLEDKLIPITNTIKYKSVNPKYDITLETLFPDINSFIIYLKKYIKDKKISDEELINTTILDLAEKKISSIYPTMKQYLIDIYPYYSELGVLNALEAIHLFTNEFSDKMNYSIINGGMEQLAEILYTKLKAQDTVDIFKECPLEKITKELNINDETTETTETTDTNHYEITCNNSTKLLKTNNLIITIPKNKLLQIEYLTKNKNLLNNINSVQNEPLYRIYARYPLDKKTGKVWFDGMEKISTNLPIKYILPINSKKGIIMISYTDSLFANYWNKKLISGTFENTLNKQLKLLFPDINIPKAKWYKHCFWTSGAGYWKSGYDSKTILKEMIQPLENENLYICGENYSNHQAWVEGALETSNLVLAKLGISIKLHHKITKLRNTKHKTQTQIKTKTKTKLHSGSGHNIKKNKTKNKTTNNVLKEYTLAEVAKHNKKTDAWIVINKKVANITKWIPKHPGGDIIMKGVGKDATALFNNIGHDDYAKKMVKKYQIGILKKE